MLICVTALRPSPGTLLTGSVSGGPIHDEVGTRMRPVTYPDPDDVRFVWLGWIEKDETRSVIVANEIKLSTATFCNTARVNAVVSRNGYLATKNNVGSRQRALHARWRRHWRRHRWRHSDLCHVLWSWAAQWSLDEARVPVKLLLLLLLMIKLLLLWRPLPHHHTRTWSNLSWPEVSTGVVQGDKICAAHASAHHGGGQVHAGSWAWHQNGCRGRVGRPAYWYHWYRSNNFLLAHRSNVGLDILNCGHTVREGDVGPVASFLDVCAARWADARVVLFGLGREEAEVAGMSVPLFAVSRIGATVAFFS